MSLYVVQICRMIPIKMTINDACDIAMCGEAPPDLRCQRTFANHNIRRRRSLVEEAATPYLENTLFRVAVLMRNRMQFKHWLLVVHGGVCLHLVFHCSFYASWPVSTIAVTFSSYFDPRNFFDTFIGVDPDGLSGAGRGAATAMMDLLCLTWLIWWRFGIFGRLIWDFYKFLWALTWKIVQIPAFKSCMSCIYHLEQLAHGEASSVSAAAWYLH